MRHMLIASITGLALLALPLAAAAQAQTEIDEPSFAPLPPESGVAVSGGVPAAPLLFALDEKEIHLRMLKIDQPYRQARNRKLAGTILTAAGGGTGLILLALGAAWNADLSAECRDDWCLGWGVGKAFSWSMMISGGLMLVASLAVGVPLIVQGNARMQRRLNERMHDLVPRVSLVATSREAGLGLSWQF